MLRLPGLLLSVSLTPEQATANPHLQRRNFPFLWKSHNHILLTFKVKFPGQGGRFQSLCWIPRLENLLWALELSQQYKNFSSLIVLQVMGHLLSDSVMATSFKRMYAPHCTSQDGCSQSPCGHGRPLLTHGSTGDTQTPKGRSGSVSCGGPHSFPWVLVHTRFHLCPLSISGRYDFDFTLSCTLPTILLWLLLCPCM